MSAISIVSLSTALSEESIVILRVDIRVQSHLMGKLESQIISVEIVRWLGDDRMMAIRIFAREMLRRVSIAYERGSGIIIYKRMKENRTK